MGLAQNFKMTGCLTAEIKKGKLYVRSKKSKKCEKKVQEAQDLIDSIPTRKIIIK